MDTEITRLLPIDAVIAGSIKAQNQIDDCTESIIDDVDSYVFDNNARPKVKQAILLLRREALRGMAKVTHEAVIGIGRQEEYKDYSVAKIVKGEKGDRGDRGRPGSQGDTGLPGVDGAECECECAGEVGETGEKGEVQSCGGKAEADAIERFGADAPVFWASGNPMVIPQDND